MTQRTPFQFWYGRDEPPVEAVPLRAGPVTAELVGRDLRHVCYGGLEIAQRVYIAIRDRNWDTVPGVLSDLTVEQGEDAFAVRFTVTHRRADVDLSWQGEILGQVDGTISYAMDCTVHADLDYKLIGLNVHHGMREYVGRPYAGDSPAGPVAGVFTSEIFPQLVADETEVPIFPDVSRLTTQLTDTVAVTFTFAGDTFEFEDQRNWTDGSFKSQSYPPRRGGLSHASAGEHVYQQVTMRAEGPVPAAASSAAQVTLTVGKALGRGLPPIGFGMASHGGELTPRDIELLRATRPAHLRTDLHIGSEAYPTELARAERAALALDCALELALFVTDNAALELAELAARLGALRAPARRVLVYHETEPATAPQWLEQAHTALDGLLPGATFASGSNAHFCELNRHRPGRPPGDAIAYSITPQVHAFDERSLAENLAPQAETVRSAHAFSGAPVVVSPVTLRPRFNAVAQSEVAVAADELPYAVDARQMSLFGAGWTLGSVKYLAEAGANAMTYYETTGWQGLIETQDGPPNPGRFPARADEAHPLYHVFADLAEMRGGEIFGLQSDQPEAVVGLGLSDAGGKHILLANLTSRARLVVVTPWPDGDVAVRALDSRNALQAMRSPAGFRRETSPARAADGSLRLVLEPFATVRLH